MTLFFWFVVKHQNGAGNVTEEVINDCTSDEVALPIHRTTETPGMRSYNRDLISNVL